MAAPPVTDSQIKAHLYLHAVLPQLEEVVRVDAAAQAVVAGWRSSIAMQVAGGPGVRLEFAAGRLNAVRRGRGLPSLGLLLPSPAAVVRMFEAGGARPLPWMGGWRLRLIAGLRTLSGRLQYYLKADRARLETDGAFAAAVLIRLAVLVYAIAVLAECLPEGGGVSAGGAGDGVVSIGVAGANPLQLHCSGGRITASRCPHRRANVTVEFADASAAFGILSGSADLWTAIGIGDVRLRGHLLLLDPILQLMARVGSFL
ncbi:MAG: hypothetical protein OXH96_05155 [Spirochaetaceae bacterium]|nr:hypothetical protein [Spirochaetaceae bacterium]